jgi:hypothetical protein
MSLFKRHFGRRVTVVGVGVALLMLGLEAPAFAAAPVVSSFTPGSGPATGGCVVVVTGTALDDFSTATVEFVLDAATTPDATDYAIISDTEMWVVAPVLVAGNAYTIRVTNAGGSSTSSGTFLATAAGGGCSPTVASFKPTCGSANTPVVITGTNLLKDVAGPQGSIVGGTVQFTPYATDATHTFPDVDTATSLSVFVSSDAADGPIKVVTFAGTAGTAFSDASFQVPPPDCKEAVPFARSITLRLRDALVARGKVTAAAVTPAAPAGCTAAVPVKIQRRRAGGGWKTVGSTTTSDTGGYRKKIRNRHGKYRSLAPKLTLESGDVCSRAVSKVVKH